MGGASRIKIDLHPIVDTLRLLESDLHASYWDCAGDGELLDRRRRQLAFAMRLVRERVAAFQDLVLRMGCSVVRVGESRAERGRLRAAVQLLERFRSIDDAEPFDQLLCSVTAVLNAADVVSLRAAGGRPEAPSRSDAARIEHIAIEKGGIVLARIVPHPPPRSAEVATDARNVGS
jgi:hypothetical protein